MSRCRPSQGSHRREPIPSVSTLLVTIYVSNIGEDFHPDAVTICISNIREEFLAMLVALIVTGQSVGYNIYSNIREEILAMLVLYTLHRSLGDPVDWF